jgi:hypothetical protein
MEVTGGLRAQSPKRTFTQIKPAIGFDPKRISAFSVPEARLQLSPEWYKTLAGGALTLQARLTTLGPPDRAMA